jgi:hypothetical protein
MALLMSTCLLLCLLNHCLAKYAGYVKVEVKSVVRIGSAHNNVRTL